jgi:ABC-2 type transport system ATP-binding protein
MMSSINIEHINHDYGGVKALNDIHIQVGKGELFGLIGPDGAGKTTLFRILTTLIIPTAGKAWVEGYDVVADYKEIRKIVGYMPGRFSLYQDLTVRENLNFFATIFNTSIQENYDLIKDIYIQLQPFEGRRAGALSGGMKQKLALCCALIHRPKVLFLDEPTTGVDAVSRKEFWVMLKRLKEKGITIFVSTPYMDEASLCDRIALMQEGKIFTVETPAALIQQFPHKLLGIKSADMYQLLLDLEGYENADRTYAFGEYHHTILEKGTQDELHRYLKNAGHKDIIVEVIQPTVEDCFLDYMNALES